MAAATNLQVQNYVDQQIRPYCEAARALAIWGANIEATIGDVYTALTEQNPTWTDERMDGPPHLMAPNDVLAVNTFIHDVTTAITGDGQYPIVLEACVRPELG